MSPQHPIHLSQSAPSHLREEHGRGLRQRHVAPPATSVASYLPSADDQLSDGPDYRGLRGLPAIGAGPGAIRDTRPGTDGHLDRLLQLSAATGIATYVATAPAL